MAAYEKAPHSLTPINASSSSILKGDIEVQSPVGDLRFQDEKIVEEPQGRATPTRKYSVEWWKTTWNGAVRVGKWPRIVYCGIGFVFIMVWIGIMLSLVDQEQKHEAKNTEGKSHRNVAGANPQADDQTDNEQVLLQGSIVNFNIEKRALTVSWSGLYSPNSSDPDTPPTPMGNVADENYYVFSGGLEIYRDISATPYSLSWRYNNSDGSLNETYSWVSFQTDNQTAVPIGVIGAHIWDSFETDITFTQKLSKNAWRQPLLGYPFDQWEGKIAFVANDLWLANETNHTRGAVFPLSGIQLTDSTLNWRFDYRYEDACAVDWTKVNPDDISTYPKNCHLEVTFWASRPPLLIFCAVAAVFVNWTCALFIFILTCEAIIMRRSYMLRGTDILSMCFTALFALPTIRALLPGAPAYGAIIDLVGILPCTLIVALCAVSVAVAKLNKRYKLQ
ncbi:hypothetical protein FRC14_000910 [Serendipita sp. 396]|nr:hypothetical protein FRC14_000910 [Serendipita sp. 396]KAG8815777.1 hypothetical protein FRC19_000820 [Serendipita sp. 401]KAG8840444.1 hypothetical protein FRB91_006078 [Serendipita sp. 411]KAG8855264.1 hypothetical protein FRC20_000800 [Serendipita sp. 405]KAG9040730.1 hypothetical protein FS842_002868 [Serendipita sp. 407]